MKKNILALFVLLTLALTPLAGLQVAKADFISCVAGGGNVLKCAEESQAADTTTSFTDFQGGLQAPSAEGYAPALTQATDVRTYALNISNFALGFLALIAVLIIIYGGFLYVTAAGKEEQAGKGKKAISYAVIGILIIMGSFAIVNTVLQAPGGQEGGLQGAAEGTTVTGATTQGRFNSIANRVTLTARDVATAFQFHFDSLADMSSIKTNIQCPTAQIPPCTTLSAFGNNMNDAQQKITNMKNRLSDEVIDSILIRSALDDLADSVTTYGNAVNSAVLSATMMPIACIGLFGVERTVCENQAAENAIKGVSYDMTIFNDAEKAVKGNFKSTIISVKASLKEMYTAVGPVTDLADELFGALVALDYLNEEAVMTPRDRIDAATGFLRNLDVAVSAADKIASQHTSLLADVIAQFSALYSTLKDIQFVDARITASVTQGNAPLVVNFSSVGSLDPSGLTIQDSQIQWDLDGDGNPNSSPGPAFMNCQETALAATTCTYLQAGTYRARLYIAANAGTDQRTGKTWDQQVGAGVAIITIRVNPPQTKIRLSIDNIDTEGDPYYLMDYDDNGFLTVNRSSVTVLTSKALNQGVQFNAKLTEAKEGLLSAQVGQGATIKWDFGDNSTGPYNKAVLAATDENLRPPPHIYMEEGTYTVTAEFKDMNGNVDRKIFTVVVSSIAPVMTINPVTVKLGDEVRFDGSSSASDNGQLKYKWNVTPTLEGLDPSFLDDATFTYKFAKPGTYQVSLEVEDPIPTIASTSKENLTVTSQPPVSQFSVEFPRKTQPGTVVLDGTRSYDPDGTGPLNYQWEINGQKLATTSDYEFVDNTTPTIAKAVVKFKKTGTYKVSLLVTDPAEPNLAGEKAAQRDITVDNILDITWGAADVVSTILKETAAGDLEGPVTLTLQSESAVAYEVDYGDGQRESGEMSTKTAVLKHNYKEAGTFVVKASVYDAEDKGNSVSRKVFVGSSTKPVAVIGISLNGMPIIPEPGETFEITRTDIVGFDATGSRNTDGTGRRLNYSWDLGDGERSTRERLNKTYGNTGTYKVTLRVVNSEDVSQTGTDTFDIVVKGEPPTLQSLTAIPSGTSLTTPVTVQLAAIGAVDPDGRITRYRWWYYDPANDQDELGVQVSASPNATVTIGTRGDEGQNKTYKFAVQITDNENNTVSSRDILPESIAPELTVTNGPNKPPVASFTVDRTFITVGESVNFTSSSVDPDGFIKAYYWDFEGDGFADNTQNLGANVSHTFKTPAPNGIRVRLKVVDNNESEAVSNPVVIYVEGKAQPPTAAFTSAQEGTTKKVKFTNNSGADTAAGASLVSYAWDFDTATDADGDGKKDNDVQSTDKDPTYEYPDYGIYRAKLVVTDSTGLKGEVTNFVNVKAPAAVTATPTTPQQTVPLSARLLTTPAPSFVDGKVHLKGESQDVILDFSTSTGNIVKYVIDKNIYFDSNGSGRKDDDEDYVATAPGKWTTNFNRAYGSIRVRLTIFDDAGRKATVDKDIVFDQTAGSVYTANIFSTRDFGFVSLMALIAGFAIMSVKRRILPIIKQK